MWPYNPARRFAGCCDLRAHNEHVLARLALAGQTAVNARQSTGKKKSKARRPGSSSIGSRPQNLTPHRATFIARAIRNAVDGGRARSGRRDGRSSSSGGVIFSRLAPRIALATPLQSFAISSLLASSARRHAIQYAFPPEFDIRASASRSI